MSSKGTQFAAGLLLGGLASGAAWYYLSPQREELAALTESNDALAAEVAKGKQVKDSYEKLKKEVEDQENRVAELIGALSQEADRSRVNQMVQKFAQSAGLGRMQESKASDRPLKSDYYTEHETQYRYLGGYHEFGRFLSYVSGCEKIIAITDITASRNPARSGSLPATIEFKLLVFVHDPKADQAAGQAKPRKG